MKRLLASTAVIALCAMGVARAEEAAKPVTDVATELSHAHALRQAGQLPEAASALAQIMLMAPDDVRVIGEYGKVMAQENRGQDAVAFLKRATELDPNDWSLWSALGVGYDESNDPKNAASAYQRALALKPGEPAVLNNYGMSRMLTGDMTGAQMMFAQARSNDPRVTNNAALLAEIQASKMPARAPAPTPVKTQQSVAIAPKPAMPQPKPQMEAATQAPKAVATPTPPKPQQTVAAATPQPNTAATATPTATGAPRAIAANSSGVVMQAVPKDPLAGPVKPKVIARKAPAKPALPTPALRTAADTH